MKRVLLVLLVLCSAAVWSTESARRVRLDIDVTVTPPAGTRQVRLWVPVPQEAAGQQVCDLQVEGSGRIRTLCDGRFGNRILTLEGKGPTHLHIAAEVARQALAPALPDRAADSLGPSERAALESWLEPDGLVTMTPRIQQMATQVTAGRADVLSRARAIYDYVRTSVRYDKSGEGWGRGDTEWVCDSRHGNCTDFHSLFLSLCRASGIPARFCMGVALPAATAGTLSGYHCWAEFFVPGAGWLPVDASEASQHPERASALFGRLDPDRVQLSLGRDIPLPGTQAVVNYFFSPYAEADGKPLHDVSMTLRYQDLR